MFAHLVDGEFITFFSLKVWPSLAMNIRLKYCRPMNYELEWNAYWAGFRSSKIASSQSNGFQPG